jgi:hypothetical protein
MYFIIAKPPFMFAFDSIKTSNASGHCLPPPSPSSTKVDAEKPDQKQKLTLKIGHRLRVFSITNNFSGVLTSAASNLM